MHTAHLFSVIDDVKDFSRVSANPARTFENTSRDFPNSGP